MEDKFDLEMQARLPLRELVFQTLRDAILKGSLPPGEHLMEIPLATRLGVSRTPVREAIRKLELEGLVRMVPRRGAVVAEITVQDVEDVLEVRTVLEELAVRKACANISQAQVRDLKKTVAEFRRSLEKGDLTASAENDMAFHEILYAAAENRRLQQILQNLREQMYRFRLAYLKDKQTHRLLIEEHDAIAQAIQKNDPAQAQQAMRAHIQNQKDRIVGRLTENLADTKAEAKDSPKER